MKKYSVVQELSLQDIQNNFKRIGRDSFSLEALEVILDNEIEIQSNDILDLDYVAIDCSYVEYDNIEELKEAYNYLLVDNMEEEEIKEEISHNVGYLYTLDSSYLVRD